MGLTLVIAAGLLAVLYGIFQTVALLKAPAGNEKMREIALAIQEGAQAYLRRQYTTIAIVGVVVIAALAVFFKGWEQPVGFLIGAVLSGAAGFAGMLISVRANVRTAQAASQSLAGGLKLAFTSGAITGMLVAGFALLGVAGYYGLLTRGLGLDGSSREVVDSLVCLGFGASLISIFARLGGGIFTKGADVGGDMVGKVEAGIPEDDPRNAATIADNVGDNVGDCAGMAADLFESYEITIISSLILGYSAFDAIHKNPTPAVLFPLIVPAIGIFASIVGVLVVRARAKDRNAMSPINRGFWLAALLTVIGAFLVAQFYVHDLKVFWAVLTGVVLSLVASQITEEFTSTERGPVKEIAASARTGPATTVLSGFSIGLESSVYAIIAIAIALGVAIGLGNGNIQLTFYLVALIGIGLLATAGMVVSEDSFGPVSDNAAGIAEMSGEFTGEAERVMVSLDAVGNTTKAITKGVAIGSAVIASVALFASFIETIGSQLGLRATGPKLFKDLLTQINVANPTTFIGLLIGGSIAFLFSSLAIRAVGRSAGTVVLEVRRQFREHPGIMDYSEKPEYGRVISICTAASQRELATPALLAILSPVIIGFGINYFALGAFLAGTILTGQLMANTLSNSGGAWDNAKKYIEDGNEGGKGSEAHKAAVIGDTVGDPFKDTAGPALNPMIKVMNLVSLLILPAVITLRHHTGERLAIAGVSLVILLVALAFSKRASESMDAAADDSTPAPAAVASAD